jgi:hypothetical protein
MAVIPATAALGQGGGEVDATNAGEQASEVGVNRRTVDVTGLERPSQRVPEERR